MLTLTDLPQQTSYSLYTAGVTVFPEEGVLWTGLDRVLRTWHPALCNGGCPHYCTPFFMQCQQYGHILLIPSRVPSQIQQR